MISYMWPIVLVVLSNIIYHICAKSMPDNVSPFASLTITYLIAAILSAILFFVADKGQNIIEEFRKMNWTSYVLGIVIVGLEAGTIYAYRAGWQIGTEAIVQSSFLAIALIIVGTVLFKENLSWNKLLGIGICIVGLFFINYK